MRPCTCAAAEYSGHCLIRFSRRTLSQENVIRRAACTHWTIRGGVRLVLTPPSDIKGVLAHTLATGVTFSLYERQNRPTFLSLRVSLTCVRRFGRSDPGFPGQTPHLITQGDVDETSLFCSRPALPQLYLYFIIRSAMRAVRGSCLKPHVCEKISIR